MNEERGLYKFEVDCGRMGVISGLFVATVESVSKAIGSELYFDEVLGKHSEVHAEFDDETVRNITADAGMRGCEREEFLSKLVTIVGSATISGLNPFHHMIECDYEPEDDCQEVIDFEDDVIEATVVDEEEEMSNDLTIAIEKDEVLL